MAPETILGTVKLARLANSESPSGANLISSAARTIPGKKFLTLVIIFLIFFHPLSIFNNLIILSFTCQTVPAVGKGICRFLNQPKPKILPMKLAIAKTQMRIMKPTIALVNLF